MFNNQKVNEVSECLDLEGLKKWNVLLTGQTHTGKTLWGCYIASVCNKNGFLVIVVDPVGVWKYKSDLPQVITVENGQDLSVLPITLSQSVIFDVSGLLVQEQIYFVNQLASAIYHLGDNGYDWERPILFCLEEAEVYARNLKSNAAQELYRLSMSGRNLGKPYGYEHGVRMLYITPRLANIATELVELSGQRYHGNANEEGSLRKVRKMYGKDWLPVVKRLKVGEFIYAHGNNGLFTVKVPEFKRRCTPQELNVRQTTRGPQISLWSLVKKLFILFVFLYVVKWIFWG